MKKYALLSVSDKRGICEFASKLHENGYEILSTGGTARKILEHGIPVTKVSNHTGHPEVMNGRVKTLHPKIHGGILGLRDIHQEEANSHNIPWIDIVVVNLYPFKKTIADPDVSTEKAIEQIDIGGPSMLRSAAKNFKHVSVVCDPSDYDSVLQNLDNINYRQSLALKAFQHTADYDAMIANWMSKRFAAEFEFSEKMFLPLTLSQVCRYGENPHQKAAFYRDDSSPSLSEIEQHQGKKLSFNNLGDLDAALRMALSFEEPVCIIVKHMNPCGAAVHADGPAAAFQLALSADPISSYGGIIAFNRPLTGDDVRTIRMSKTFFEIIAAPGFDDLALERLKPKEKIRVLEFPQSWVNQARTGFDARRVMGGWLLQDWDDGAFSEWEVVSSNKPSEEQLACAKYAWRISQAVKSNAIVLAKTIAGGHVLNGVGAGQMSRLDSVDLAMKKATRPVENSVLASDAFFPFPDGVVAAMEKGVKVFVQPGGSVRDDKVIAAVEENGGVMIFTRRRHFRH